MRKSRLGRVVMVALLVLLVVAWLPVAEARADHDGLFRGRPVGRGAKAVGAKIVSAGRLVKRGVGLVVRGRNGGRNRRAC